MTEEIIYRANDGTPFNDDTECLEYELQKDYDFSGWIFLDKIGNRITKDIGVKFQDSWVVYIPETFNFTDDFEYDIEHLYGVCVPHVVGWSYYNENKDEFEPFETILRPAGELTKLMNWFKDFPNDENGFFLDIFD